MAIGLARNLALVATLSILAGCTNPRYVPGEWPTAMPAKEHYGRIWDHRPENQELQSKKEYFTWLIRFYEGWALVPQGWHATEKILLKDVEEKDYPRLAAKLAYLGQLISGEWALDKRIKRVHTSMLRLWGGVMRKAKKNGRMEETIDRIIPDVIALIQQELKRENITRKRYE